MWAKTALPSMVRTRTTLPLSGVEYLVVAQAETARSKMRCVLSVFVYVLTKEYQSNLSLVSISLQI